jgi:hypothetical protein
MYRFYNYAELFKPDEIIDYLRKSQSDDPLLTVEEVLAKHESILDEWDDKYLNARVPEENRFREIVSGETIKERPEINKVLRLIESPKYKAIKIVEPQRLTRGDLEDIGRIMKLLKHTNTYIITPERMYDLSDEYDWNAFETELKRGNDYLNYYKKIQKRGRLISVSQGNYIGSVPPYGYEKTSVMDGKRKCPTLIENPEQADVVRMIFDMYVNKNIGATSICTQLNKMGIKPPKGAKWSDHTISDILQNIHYIGKVKWNHRKTVTIVEDGEIIQTRPKAENGEFLVYEGKHNGIISEELFYAAIEKRGKTPKVKLKTELKNPLAGLIFCSKCGKAITLRSYTVDKYHKNRPARLICDNGKYCQTGSVIYDEMIEKVCQILEQCIKDFEIHLQNDEGNSIKIHAKLISNLEKRMKNLEEMELSQWEQQSHPDPAQRMPAEIFKQLNEKLLKEKEDVKQALRNARQSMPEPVDYEEKTRRFKDALDALRNPDADAEFKNKLLKACIERIEYSREHPQRITSQRVKYYDKERKQTRCKSPLSKGSTWTQPPVELDVKLKV